MRGMVGLVLAAALAAAPAFAQTPPAAAPAPASPAQSGLPGPGQRGYIPNIAPDHDVLDQGILLLVPGRIVTVTVGENNAMTVTAEKASDPGRFPQPDNTPNTYAAIPVYGKDPGPPEKDRLSFTMEKGPSGVGLVIENGLNKPVSLVAAISWKVGDQRRTTLSTICTAGPGKRDFETWGGPLDVIQVIQVLDTPEGSCFDPFVKALYRDGDVPPSARPPSAPAPTPPGAAASPSRPGS